MKKTLVHVLATLFLLTLGTTLSAQQDLLKGILEGEEPVFHTTFVPTGNEGELLVVVYFTHSKVESLESSVWLIDHGATLSSSGSRQMVRGLREIGNRRPDTIRVSGLSNQHFYSIGLDYRNPRKLSGKFTTTTLQSNYRYEYLPPSAEAAVRQTTPAPPSGPVQKGAAPCVPPALSVVVQASGYCGPDDRPAIQLQCSNCPALNWDFSVEVKAEAEAWRPLRSDGQRQTAFGGVIRTEPLCILRAGRYQVRVLAWGANCPNPVVQDLREMVLITERGAQAVTQSSQPPAFQQKQAVASLPDTCIVEARAALSGDAIRGTLMLNASSPCAGFYPYAEVRYVHPGHRDQQLDRLALAPGKATTFALQLDDLDMARNIHPLQIVVRLRQEPNAPGIPISSFWIRADQNPSAPASNEVVQGRSPVQDSQLPPPAVPIPQSYSNYEDLMLEETSDTVGVVASDPNCPQIQELNLVQDVDRPELPAFLSWLSPRCCQEEGCSYSVWGGSSPSQLRLLVKGSKPGATVREVLPDLSRDDQYFEVVVKTSNGNRKAAYVTGIGPLYGIEQISDYHDRLRPQSSTPIVGVKGSGSEPQADMSGTPVATWDLNESAVEADRQGRLEVLRRTITNSGIPVRQLKLDLNGNQASISGEVDQQVDKERLLLIVKNTASIVEVDDRLSVASNQAATPDSFNWTGSKTPPPAEPIAEGARPRLPLETFEPCQIVREVIMSGDRTMKEGTVFSIRYDYDREGYRFTLYHQPSGSTQWNVAPGTKELQESPLFQLKMTPKHSGKYVVLAYKPEKGWGCLSNAPAGAAELKVTK